MNSAETAVAADSATNPNASAPAIPERTAPAVETVISHVTNAISVTVSTASAIEAIQNPQKPRLTVLLRTK